MSTYPNDKSPLGTLVTWLLVAILAIAALKMAFWVLGVLGVVVGVGLHLLFTLGPILLVGWLVVVVYRALTRPRSDPMP